MEISLKRLTKTGRIANGIVLLSQQKSYTFGSQSKNDVVLRHPTISKKHCIFHHNSYGLFVEVLKDSRGVSINDEECAAGSVVHLKNNDFIQIGPTYKYQLFFEVAEIMKNEEENANVHSQIEHKYVKGGENTHLKAIRNPGMELPYSQLQNCYVNLGKRVLRNLTNKAAFIVDDSIGNTLQNLEPNDDLFEIEEHKIIIKKEIEEISTAYELDLQRKFSITGERRENEALDPDLSDRIMMEDSFSIDVQDNKDLLRPLINQYTIPEKVEDSSKNVPNVEKNEQLSAESSPDVPADPSFHSMTSEKPSVSRKKTTEKKAPRKIADKQKQPKITDYFQGDESKNEIPKEKRISLTDQNQHTKKSRSQEYRCNECRKTFLTKINLKEHMLEHFPIKKIKIRGQSLHCKQCDKEFPWPSVYETHLRRWHSKESPFSCDKCDQTFASNGELKLHSWKHTGIKPHRCTFCEKSYLSHSGLIIHLRTHTGERPFACDKCDKTFTSKILLESHATIHSTERPFSCKECGRGFKKMQTLKFHIGTHSKNKSFPCTICDRKFVRALSLKRHMWRHGEKSHHCDKCDKAFTSRLNLKHHFNRIHRDKRFHCDICDEKFTMKENLMIHIIKHIGEKPFACDKCDKTFLHKCSLKEHSRFHAGDYPFTCKICGKRFMRAANLKLHMFTHDEKKPFPCDKCAKSFSTKHSLADHHMTHASEDPFSCEVCAKRFRSHKCFKLHMKMHSTGKKPHACDKCDKSFMSLYSMKQHRMGHNGEKPFSCVDCNEKFSSKESLKVHAMKHTGTRKPFACEKCDKTFLYQSRLKLHVKTHSDVKPFSCELCGERYKVKISLQNHMMTHTGMRPLACDICGKTFSNEKVLKQHYKNHIQRKSFSCTICSKKLSSEMSLRNHILTHIRNKLFACDKCDKTFATKICFESHKKLHVNPNLFSCKICNKGFSLEKHIQIHMKKLHSSNKDNLYACGKCGEIFTTKYALATHSSEVHTSKLFCAHCDEVFNSRQYLIYHLKAHTGVAPFTCDECKKSFSTNFTLKQHRSTHVHGAQKCSTCELRFASKVAYEEHYEKHSKEEPFSCAMCGRIFAERDILIRHCSQHAILGGKCPED